VRIVSCDYFIAFLWSKNEPKLTENEAKSNPKSGLERRNQEYSIEGFRIRSGKPKRRGAVWLSHWFYGV